MSLAKVAVVCAFVALLVSACGIAQKPIAGSPHLHKDSGYRGRVDDPRTKHIPCLKTAGLHFRKYTTANDRLPAIQVGTLPDGPTIVWQPTPGAAQALQIEGKDENAEAIGSALLFPNNASASVLTKVENCVAIGVTG